MSALTAYEYTCRFCKAVQNVFVSIQIANQAASAASLGDHEKAKTIILENWSHGEKRIALEWPNRLLT